MEKYFNLSIQKTCHSSKSCLGVTWKFYFGDSFPEYNYSICKTSIPLGPLEFAAPQFSALRPPDQEHYDVSELHCQNLAEEMYIICLSCACFCKTMSTLGHSGELEERPHIQHDVRMHKLERKEAGLAALTWE